MSESPYSAEEKIPFTVYKRWIFTDLYRVDGKRGGKAMLRELLFGESYKYLFWMRTCRFTRSHRVLKWTLYPLTLLLLRRYTYRLGIAIPFATQIGEGCYIGHFGGIVINRRAVIGRNCNISQGVTIGQANRGIRQGCPTIGDGVFIGPGAKIFGAITIGNNVAIGANAVVTEDVPDHAVVAGIPARIISNRGAEGYINLTDFDTQGSSPSDIQK